MSLFPGPIPGEPQWTEQQHLVYLLQDRGIPCPRCGANLRGLQNNRCLECDSELTLSLSPVTSHLGPWITATIALCLSGGLGLFLLMVVLDQGWPPYQSPIWLSIHVCLVYFLLSIPCAVVMMTQRRRFQRLAATTQSRLALACLCLTGLAVALLLLFFAMR